MQVYIDHYNNVRLNSATGYITPKDMLAGRQREIHEERDRKLKAARKMRKDHRQQAARCRDARPLESCCTCHSARLDMYPQRL